MTMTMMIRFTLATLAITLSADVVVAVENGDKCGVTSSSFLNYDYRSDFMVAGDTGCTLGDDQGCFCAPNLDDGQSLSEWEWQCNGAANFGPTSEKVCPNLVPVAKGLGALEVVPDRNRVLAADKVASVGTESMQQKMGVPCDTALHPTGRPGDEVCPYSDCDEGGDHSAVCACVDLGKYGMGVGMEWVCMHATCSCGGEEATATEPKEEGGLNESSSESSDENVNVNEQYGAEEASAAALTLVGSALVSISVVAMVVLQN